MRRAGSLWHKRAGVTIPRKCPRHRGGPVCFDSVIVYNRAGKCWPILCYGIDEKLNESNVVVL